MTATTTNGMYRLSMTLRAVRAQTPSVLIGGRRGRDDEIGSWHALYDNKLVNGLPRTNIEIIDRGAQQGNRSMPSACVRCQSVARWGVSICCNVRCVPGPPVSVGCVYLWPSGPTYSPVAESYWAAAIGADGAVDGGCPGEADGPPGNPAGIGSPGSNCGTPCPVNVAFGSPFQLKPSLSGI